MNSGYYAACAGLRAQSQALEVMASNLANLNTTGYLGQQPTFRSLLASARVGPMTELNLAVNDFNTLGGARVDLAPGNLERTGNPLDLAVEGGGFFVIQTKAGTMYTRNGSFQVSPGGQLVTAEGDAVLGEQGPVNLPAGPVAISPDGTLSVNGAVAGKLRLVEFAAGSSPQPQGHSLYAAPADAVKTATNSSIRQGMLESSNVNPIAAAVSLIAVQRHADMLQRALSAFYGEFNRIVADDLPRV